VNQLPGGWSPTTLGALGRYLNGRAFKKSEWREHGRPIIRIQNLTGSGESFNYFQGDVEDRYVARPGDLLVSWAATLGAFIWNGPEAVVNQHIFKVESNIDVRFHKYLLDHKLKELMRHTHGSGMVHITRSKFDSVPVAIPRLEEQRRIVEMLEDRLSRLDAADQAVREGRDAISLVRLSALVRARRAMVERGVHIRPVGDICDTTLGKMLDAKKSSGAPTPYLRNINVRWRHVDESDVWTVPLTDSERERFALRPGDVLVCEGGEPGRCAVWGGSSVRMTFQKALHRLRVRDGAVEPQFVAAMIEEAIRSGCAAGLFTGTTIKHLPQERLRALKIPVPDLSLQHLLLAELQELDSSIQRIETAVSVVEARSGALRRALLAAAFSGEVSRRSGVGVVEELANA